MIVKIKEYYRKGEYSCICRCDSCGKEFNREYSEASKVKHHYCSRECLYKSRKGQKKSKEWKEKVSKSLKGRKPWNKGNKYTKKEKEKLYVHMKAENNPMWKNGRIKTKQGYILLYIPKHPYCDSQKHIPEHRTIVEKYLGRYLKKGEIVHHINENKSDNRLENLILLSNGEHNILHYIIRFLKKYGTLENFYNQHKLIK